MNASNQKSQTYQCRFPVLIGDIGGTNARFSLITSPNSRQITLPAINTIDYESFENAICALLNPLNNIAIGSVILAIAAPVEGDEIKLTNNHWVISPLNLIERFKFSDVTILNDFEAQALAAAVLKQDHLHQIGNNTGEIIANRVILGPGTGLGVAGLIYSQNTWIPIATEGGHVEFGPLSKRDYEIFPHLKTIGNRIGAEEVMSGRGLLNIYQAICKTDQVKNTLTDPAQISDAGLNKSNQQAEEALMLFATYLGRMAGDLALLFLARGGVYIGGGIAQKILPALTSGHFRKAFENKAPHGDILKEISTYVVVNPLAALEGLSAFACQTASFQLDLSNRSWSAKPRW